MGQDNYSHTKSSVLTDMVYVWRKIDIFVFSTNFYVFPVLKKKSSVKSSPLWNVLLLIVRVDMSKSSSGSGEPENPSEQKKASAEVQVCAAALPSFSFRTSESCAFLHLVNEYSLARSHVHIMDEILQWYMTTNEQNV